MPIRNLTGLKFNRLTVLEFLGTRKNKSIWRCKCDCGAYGVWSSGTLVTGNTKSCGCQKRENSGVHLRTHGKSKTTEYKTWCAMIQRCENPKNPDFALYGGRGIVICKRWRESFENFLADMGRKPKGMTSIDRINTHGNYEPDNCRWTTQKQQTRNKQNNHLLTINGQTKTIAEWSEISGIDQRVVLDRLTNLNWNPHDAVFEPIKRRWEWNPRKKASL